MIGNRRTHIRLKFAARAVAWHPDGQSLAVCLGDDVAVAKYALDGGEIWYTRKHAGSGQDGLYFDTAGKIIFTSAYSLGKPASTGPSIALLDDLTGGVVRELYGANQPGGRQWPSMFVMTKARDRIYEVNYGWPERLWLEYGRPDWKLLNVAGPIVGKGGGYTRLFLGPNEASLLAPTNNGYLDELDCRNGNLLRRHRLSNSGLGPLVVLADQRTALVTLSGIIQQGLMVGPRTADPANDYSDEASTTWKIDLSTGEIVGKYDTKWPVASMTSCEATNIAVCATARFRRGVGLYALDMLSTRTWGPTILPWSESVRVSLSRDGSLLAVTQDESLSIYDFNILGQR
jgi:WD40 repeat protein